MIRIPTNISRESAAFRYLEEEFKCGIVAHYIDGKFNVFTFYYPEDECAFVLKFGKEFTDLNREDGYFYCPYIPVLLNIKL